VAQALSEGQLQKALGSCRRLIEIRPGDPEATKIVAEIESSIRDREVEDLCRMALSYASDGEAELAQKIAAKIERIAPRSKRLGQLRKYLDEERTRRQAEALTASAREYLALGKLAEALAAAEEALAVYPQHAVAREIRDRTSAVLAATEHRVAAPPREETGGPAAPPEPTDTPAAAPPGPPESTPVKTSSAPDEEPPHAPKETAIPSEAEAAPPPPPFEAPKVVPVESHAATTVAPPPEPIASRVEPTPQVAPTAPVPLTPLPEGTPSNPEAARLLESARRNLRERALDKALPLLEEAAALEPAHPGVRRLLTQTRAESRKAEIESLTSVALDAFVQNNYGKAKKAVERTLALDPANRKARELQKILGAIG
jgi:tetratricopeptide (TPR) repeat protein